MQCCVSCANDASNVSTVAIACVSGIIVRIRCVLSIVVVAHKVIAICNTTVFTKTATQGRMHVIDASVNDAHFDALACDAIEISAFMLLASYTVYTYPNSSLTLLIPVAL